jgi:hypothetical protein
MTERWFNGPDGRTWLVRTRPDVRKDEAATHVTLEFVTDNEARVISCLRDAWDTPAPDLAALLARSVAGGASRSVLGPGTPSGLDLG